MQVSKDLKKENYVFQSSVFDFHSVKNHFNRTYFAGLNKALALTVEGRSLKLKLFKIKNTG